MSWKVEGSMFGNMVSATGRSSSINGITRKMSMGTILKMSAVVLVSCRRSLRLRVFPLKDFLTYLEATFTSVASSFVPTQ